MKNISQSLTFRDVVGRWDMDFEKERQESGMLQNIKKNIP